MHNRFFYANVCHICKSTENETQLKRCSGCKMIAYCGKKHQKMHWTQHKDLCRVLNQMLTETGEKSLFSPQTQNSSQKAWSRTKTNLMLLVTLKLGRRLEHYEEQMFKFPRACWICHGEDSLQTCEKCPCASFCKDHEKNKSTHSDTITCRKLKLCFDLDVSCSIDPCYEQGYIDFSKNAPTAFPETIAEYMEDYTRINERKMYLSNDCYLARTSEYLSRVLTTLYAIKSTHYLTSSRLVVHVIGASLMEFHTSDSWETALHWHPDLCDVQIVLIGPELRNFLDLKKYYKTCASCESKKKTYSVTLSDALYENYVESEQFVHPDIVVGFNLGIHEYEDVEASESGWKSALQKIKAFECPFVLTSYTGVEARFDHDTICEDLAERIGYFCQMPNPYSSLRPLRDFENEEIFYENQYLTIYRKLEAD